MSEKFPRDLSANDIGRVIRFRIAEKAYVEDTIAAVAHERLGGETKSGVRLSHITPPGAGIIPSVFSGYYTVEWRCSDD
jgi:hypothetical protein